MRVPKWFALVAGTAVLGGGTYGIAAAASSGGGDGIAVCAQMSSGQMRLAGDAGCRKTEVALDLAAAGGADGGAYAYVDNGQLDASRSAGVNGMTFSTAPLPAGSSNVAAFYCFDLQSPASTAVATPSIVDRGAGLVFSEGVQGTVVAGSTAMAGTGCPSGTDAAVMAGWGIGSTPPQDAGFSVHFH
ncbi:MAG TPA: hypothetical protein VGG88_03755 [Gaiellaceae bacterium]